MNDTPDGQAGGNLDRVLRIPVTLKVLLGSASMPIFQLTKLGRGAVIPLDRRVGEPVDVMINGRIIARGEIVVLDEEGSVEVRHLLKVSDPRVLGPGEWVRIYKNEPLAQKMIDKGALLQRAVRAASDAFYQAALNVGRGGVAKVPTPTTGSPADSNKGQPTPPAPPPPPPPPPPPSN